VRFVTSVVFTLLKNYEHSPYYQVWCRTSQGRAASIEDKRTASRDQSFVEGRIAELEGKLSSSQIIDPALLDAEGRIVFASTVYLEDMETGEKVTYQIVGVDEADLKKYTGFLATKKLRHPNQVNRSYITEFLFHEKERKQEASSIARALVAVKLFHRFLLHEGILQEDVTSVLESPKLWKHLPSFLTLEEVERMLSQPNPRRTIGIRDRAILELQEGVPPHGRCAP